MRALLCLILIALIPVRAFASDGASSNGDSSADSSGDSSDQGGSSAQSKDSSDSSQDDQSCENSSKDSSKESTDNSTDATSKGKSGRTFTIAAAIVVAGAAIAAGIGFGATTTRRHREDAEQQLSKFLRRNHSAVVHDVALAEGPILEGWAEEWGFEPEEVQRFLGELAGSKEQVALVETMSKLESPGAARRFATELFQVMARTVGRERASAVASVSSPS